MESVIKPYRVIMESERLTRYKVFDSAPSASRAVSAFIRRHGCSSHCVIFHLSSDGSWSKVYEYPRIR